MSPMRWSLVLIVCLLVSSPLAAVAETTDTTRQADGTKEAPEHDEDPCAGPQARMDARIDEIHQRYDAEHRALDAEAERFYSGNHTEEEHRAFQQDQQQKRAALDEAERQEVDQAHADFKTECDAALQAQQKRTEDHYDQHHEKHYAREPGPADEPWMTEDCRHALETMDRRLIELQEQMHEEMRAKWDDFEARQRAERDAFWAKGNHTDEEVEAFEAEMEAQRAAFRDQVLAHEESRRDAFEREMRAFEAKVEAVCRPGEPTHATPMPYGETPAELEAIHRACEEKITRLEAAFRAEMDAMHGSHDGRNGSAQADMEAKQAAFEDQIRGIMRECEARARAYWEANMERPVAAAPHDRMGSWSFQESEGRILLTGKYVSLVGDPSTSTMRRIAVGGETFISHLDTLGQLEFFDMEETQDGDSTLIATGDAIRLRIHDDPAGVINLKADAEHAFLLELPPSLDLQPGANGWTLKGAGGTALLRVAPGQSEWTESTRVLKVWGEATFFVKDKENAILPAVANKHRDEIADAAEKRRLGAEVTVAKTQDGKSIDDAIVYDADVAVDVATADNDEDAPVTVTVSSDTLTEGRTFVVNVDGALVGKAVDITYFDVDEETGEETPAEIRKASGLSDILDATDDGTAEYWVVEDEDGLQVMVSVPHWSVHRFRLEAAEAPEDPFESLPGPAMLVVVMALVAVVAVARRRP